MLVERFEERGLSHYSYAVGSKEKGQIAIIDPRFDVDIYLDYAAKHGLVISHVLETHIHADYASGARHLAARARATLLLSGYDKGEKYEVSFPHKECFDGDRIKIGSIVLEVLHTPGHTPEHVSFLAFENDVAKALFSGDFLFCGSFGRPDLLGEDVKEPLAKKLHHSMKIKLSDLSDAVEVYPAHGADSFCGAGIGSRPSSTMGQERLVNPYLKKNVTEQDFVKLSLSHLPYCPDYFFRMKAYNVSSERDKVSFPNLLEVEDFKKRIKRGHVVIDLRSQKAYSTGHIPGSVCIGAGEKVGYWASGTVPYDTPLLMVTDDPSHIQQAVKAMARVGLSQVEGYLKGGMKAWERAHFPVEKTREISPQEMDQEEYQVVDVRSLREWATGHIAGAMHIPCLDVPHAIKALKNHKLVFVCAGGYRSILAASLAQRLGCKATAHIPGGIHAWQAAGLPLVTS